MAKKSTKSSPEALTTQLIEAAFALACERPWHSITLSDIATEANVDLGDFRDLIDDKHDILVIYGRKLDRQMLDNVRKINTDAPVKDRLFEVFMERFDILNEDRPALKSIIGSMKTNPRDALLSLPYLKKSMLWILEAAHVTSNGIRGAANILALTAIYAETLYAWQSDDSEDMAKTMATLDKALNRAENIFDKIGHQF